MNRCDVCGQFLRQYDVYGDFHMSHHHPFEYALYMKRYREQQAANALGRATGAREGRK